LHNCEDQDAHGHVANCEFSVKHRPAHKGQKTSTYEFMEQDSSLFLHYMRCRLPGLVRDYLLKTIPGNEEKSMKLRRAVWQSACGEFSGSPYFSVDRLYELLPELQ
jgi:hypothetical protein